MAENQPATYQPAALIDSPKNKHELKIRLINALEGHYDEVVIVSDLEDHPEIPNSYACIAETDCGLKESISIVRAWTY